MTPPTTNRRTQAICRPDNNHSHNPRQGFSLLEVVTAMVVSGMILVPTASMMSGVMQREAKQSIESELLHLAQAKQDEVSHAARVRFRDRNLNGQFARVGFREVRFEVQVSQSNSAGGIPDRLLAIATRVWHDENQNRNFDPGEPTVELWTAVSRATP